MMLPDFLNQAPSGVPVLLNSFPLRRRERSLEAATTEHPQEQFLGLGLEHRIGGRDQRVHSRHKGQIAMPVAFSVVRVVALVTTAFRERSHQRPHHGRGRSAARYRLEVKEDGIQSVFVFHTQTLTHKVISSPPQAVAQEFERLVRDGGRNEARAVFVLVLGVSTHNRHDWTRRFDTGAKWHREIWISVCS